MKDYKGSRRFLFEKIDADLNMLHSAPVLDILGVNGSMSFLNVMDLAVVARLYHIHRYSTKSVCSLSFRRHLLHTVSCLSRDLLQKFLRKN